MNAMTQSNVLQPLRSARHPTSSDEWEQYRRTIQRLYVAENKSLPEVIDEVEQIFGFVATERQYKRRISEWRLDKNVKDDEMRAIITLEAERIQHGKASIFYVRDRRVDPQKIKRFARRKKLNQHICTDSAPSRLPPGVRCVTPSSDFLTMDTRPSQPSCCASDTPDTMLTERPQARCNEPTPSPARKTDELNAVVGSHLSQVHRNPIVEAVLGYKRHKIVDFTPSLPQPNKAPGDLTDMPSLPAANYDVLELASPDSFLRAKKVDRGYVDSTSMTADAPPGSEPVGKGRPAEGTSLKNDTLLSGLLQAASNARAMALEPTSRQQLPCVTGSLYAAYLSYQEVELDAIGFTEHRPKLSNYTISPSSRPENLALGINKRKKTEQEPISLQTQSPQSQGSCGDDQEELTKNSCASQNTTVYLERTLSDVYQDELYSLTTTTSAPP
ncbi:MAG: hypothetical protein Q9208_008033 [Pyrenodesmia sp. 3 TL-2023]